MSQNLEKENFKNLMIRWQNFESVYLKGRNPPKSAKVCIKRNKKCYLYDSDSMVSFKLKSINPYPSLLKANMAFGPSHMLPSIRGVKWTPRNEN